MDVRQDVRVSNGHSSLLVSHTSHDFELMEANFGVLAHLPVRGVCTTFRMCRGGCDPNTSRRYGIRRDGAELGIRWGRNPEVERRKAK